MISTPRARQTGLAISLLALCLAPLAVGTAAAAPNEATSIDWQHEWSHDLFDKARRQDRFVILDLEAVWCHWCHVMDDKTYSDPKVAELINDKYIPVKVDQDANPDLSQRYGNYGWPATIVFAPDGTEIVKRRGYIPAPGMIAMLQAIVDDPSPGPSVIPETETVAAPEGGLQADQRKALETAFVELYDDKNGGWGTLHKFIDADAMAYALIQARLDNERYAHMARQTLDAAQNLIDPVWGGVYQYSDQDDWKSPHYEKIMSYQADYLRLYALAYTRWDEPDYLDTAQAIHRYLTEFLMSPEGAFYTSQSADLSQQIDGHKYYGLNGKARRKLGIPSIDKHVYARENGWAIRALTALYDATGKEQVLDQAKTAARYIIAHRGLADGGFRHGAGDRAGPYLGDTLSMGRAFLSLYRSTGEREWLQRAQSALGFIESHFKASEGGGGFISAPVAEDAKGVFREPVKKVQENVDVARFANLLARYTGKDAYRGLAQHAMRYLSSSQIVEAQRFRPGVLLADYELAREPVHITVVGHKDDAAARRLHAAALRFPAVYERIEWWDMREGKLPNADVTYPELERPAAFACADGACSLPVFEPQKLSATVSNLQQARQEQQAAR